MNRMTAAPSSIAWVPMPRRVWGRHGNLILGALLVGVWVIGALVAPVVRPQGFDDQHLEEAFQPPSARHAFGTDDLGRDVLTRVLFGGWYTLSVAIAVVAAAAVIGVLIGATSGYFGGWSDEALMRSTEVVMAFPAVILAMAIAVALGPGLMNAGLAMVLVWWPPYARLARGETLAVRQQEYIDAAVMIGQTHGGILRRAIFPNIISSIVVLATVDIGSAIVTAAGLSFLGLGASPPIPEWGAMVSSGRELLAQWWVPTFPGLAIFLSVLGFNFLGDAVRDRLDPRRQRRA